MTKLEVVINESMKKQLTALGASKNMSLDEITAEMLERGVKDACYRMKRNQQKWQETKALNERFKELEQLVAQKEEV